MINAFKRKPTIFQFMPNNYVTVLEFSVGKTGQEDFDLNKIDEDHDGLVQAVSEFIRHVYAVVPTDYTPDPHINLMKAWNGYTRLMALSFVDILQEFKFKENEEEIPKTIRLLAICRNNNIRFNVHFLFDERDQVVELPFEGYLIKASNEIVTDKHDLREQEFVLTIDLPARVSQLGQMYSDIENIEMIDKSVDSFAKAASERFDSIARIIAESQRKLLNQKGASILTLSKVKTELFARHCDKVAVASEIKQVLSDIVDLRMSNGADLENQPFVTTHHTLKLSIMLVVKHPINEDPELSVVLTISSNRIFKYKDSSRDSEFILHYSSKPYEINAVFPNPPAEITIVDPNTIEQ